MANRTPARASGMPAAETAAPYAGRPGPTARRRPGLLVRPQYGQGWRHAGIRSCWSISRTAMANGRACRSLRWTARENGTPTRANGTPRSGLLDRPYDGKSQRHAGDRASLSVRRTDKLDGHRQRPATSGPASREKKESINRSLPGRG